MSDVSVDRRRAAGWAVGSYKCACGAKKRAMKTFCESCWGKLSIEMRSRLTRMVKGTFVLAYEDARKALGLPEMEIAQPATAEMGSPEVVA